MNVRLEYGKFCMTAGVAELVETNDEFSRYVWDCLQRHVSGDWGDLCEEDRRANRRAIIHGGRIFSSYRDPRFVGHGVASVWIITEADRSLTTALFPDEY